MKEYPKIQTIFERDPNTKHKTLLIGRWARPEFEYLAGCDWVFTEKVDGTNIRIMYHGPNSPEKPDTLEFGGKTDKAEIPPKLLDRLNEIFMPQLPLFREKFADGVCFYGEGYGAGIQKSGVDYRPDQDFVLFDVKINQWWLQRETIESIAKEFGIDVVPIIGYGNLYDMIDLVKEGFNSTWGDFRAEGIVARPAVQLFNRDGERVIVKLKTRDFQHAKVV